MIVCYHVCMSKAKNIEQLLEKAMTSKQGGVNPWYERVPSEVQPFIDGLKSIIRQGKKPNASSVSRILTEEYNFPVSRTRVANWIQKYTNDIIKEG